MCGCVVWVWCYCVIGTRTHTNPPPPPPPHYKHNTPTGLKECLLTNQPLLKILHKVMVVCLLFAGYMEQAARDFDEAAAAASSSEQQQQAYASKGAGEQQGPGAMFVPLDPSSSKRPGSRGAASSRSTSPAGATVDGGTQRRARLGAATAGVRARAAAAGFERAMAAFGAHLDHHLREFMLRLREDSKAQYHSHLSNLLTRLDYNGFFGAAN